MLIFLKKNKPFKFLILKKKTRLSGKSFGVINMRHRGGGIQMKYRSVDFYKSL